MEEVIREGTLRMLTTETSCDVILSCQGNRLMAHKIILSIASPVLQELLLEDNSVPAVLIFPDIPGSTMSLILDYIYTGSATVFSSDLPEFISVCKLLNLKLSYDYSKLTQKDKYKNQGLYHGNSKIIYNSYGCSKINYNNESCNKEYYNKEPHNKEHLSKEFCNKEHLSKEIYNKDLYNKEYYNSKEPYDSYNSKESYDSYNSKESFDSYNSKEASDYHESREVHDVTPEDRRLKIRLLREPSNSPPVLKPKKELFNKVFPSPWGQRISPVVADPRKDCFFKPELTVSIFFLILTILNP